MVRQHAPLAFSACLDRNKDGQITLREWSSVFDVIDDNHNGVISRKEWCLHEGDTELFDAIASRRHLAAISRKEWEHAFKALDANNDGVIPIEALVPSALLPPSAVRRRPVVFDMNDCRDVLLLRALELEFDCFGAYVLRAKHEPAPVQRLCHGDRLVSVNGRSLYREEREDIEFQLRHAQSAGRRVQLVVEPACEAKTAAAPRLGDRLRALAIPADQLESTSGIYEEGDHGRVYAMEGAYALIAWERTGRSRACLGCAAASQYAVTGQVKAVPEVGDLVHELPGDPFNAEGVPVFGRVTQVDAEEVHIIGKGTRTVTTVATCVFLKFYTCIGRSPALA